MTRGVPGYWLDKTEALGRYQALGMDLNMYAIDLNISKASALKKIQGEASVTEDELQHLCYLWACDEDQVLKEPKQVQDERRIALARERVKKAHAGRVKAAAARREGKALQKRKCGECGRPLPKT